MSVKINEWPGTALSEKDFSEGKVLYRHDELHGLFAWDTGVAISRYLAGLKNGIILGVYCRHCRKTVVPPRVVCEMCFSPLEEFVPLEDTGTVNTFSICYITWNVQRIKDPEIPAVIEIDGSSPGHGILHKLDEVNPQEVRVGMRVKAVWKVPEERQGAITDILHFKPIQEG